MKHSEMRESNINVTTEKQKIMMGTIYKISEQKNMSAPPRQWGRMESRLFISLFWENIQLQYTNFQLREKSELWESQLHTNSQQWEKGRIVRKKAKSEFIWQLWEKKAELWEKRQSLSLYDNCEKKRQNCEDKSIALYNLLTVRKARIASLYPAILTF